MFTLIPRRVSVPPGWVMLEYCDGARTRVLEPGRYRRPASATYVSVPTREQLTTVALQEILTSDSVSVRVSAAVRFVVVDPARYVEAADRPLELMYLATQVALRIGCAAVTVEDLMRRSSAIDPGGMAASVQSTVERLGIEVLEVVIKDVVVPAEIRSAAADLVTTRARGLARIEAARAETASLRALANAGRLLEQYPALAQLRMIEAAPPGSRVVLSAGSAQAAVSLSELPEDSDA